MSKLTNWPQTRQWPFGFEMDEFFRPFSSPARSDQNGQDWMPSIDVTEAPDSYQIKAEVPGINPNEVQVTMSGDTMTLRGEKRTEEEREDDHRHVTERRYGMFQRTFTFPTAVDAETVSAECDNGLLSITVKKAKESRPFKIKVKKR